MEEFRTKYYLRFVTFLVLETRLLGIRSIGIKIPTFLFELITYFLLTVDTLCQNLFTLAVIKNLKS